MKEVFSEFLINERLVTWLENMSPSIIDINQKVIPDKLEKLLSLILCGIPLPTIVICQSTCVEIIGNADIIYTLYNFYNNKSKIQCNKFNCDIASRYKIYNDMYYNELPEKMKLRIKHARFSVIKIYTKTKDVVMEKLIKEIYE